VAAAYAIVLLVLVLVDAWIIWRVVLAAPLIWELIRGTRKGAS
jgi:hypothetical protein